MMFIQYNTMGLDNLLYYVINLIDEEHKWQYQNATNSNKAPLLYFTPLQFIAILLSFFFVIYFILLVYNYYKIRYNYIEVGL